MIRDFKQMENKSDDSITDAIAFSDGQFKDIIFRLSRVAFGEDENGPTLDYDYEVLRGEIQDKDKAAFEKEVGDFIISIIEEQMSRIETAETPKDYAFAGGVDEIDIIDNVDIKEI